MIKRIDLNPERNYTFSSAVVAGDYIFTAHHAGFYDEKGTIIKGIEDQTEQCFRNLERTLEACGAGLKDVVKTTVYLKDLRDFDKMKEVYRRRFAGGYPARMTSTSSFLHDECLIMIEAVAYKLQA